MANWLQKIFGITEPKQQKNIATVHEAGSGFSRFSGDKYASDVYRSAVDSIARNGAKLKPSHFVDSKNGHDELNRILQYRWNPYMNTYDGLYKVITHYFLHNNSFIYIDRDEVGKPIALYPIRGQSIEFGTNTDHELFVKFTFKDGSNVYLPYSDLIHLRRHFNDNELLGDDNRAIDDILQIAKTQSEGLVKNIKLGANLRGIVTFTSLVNDTQLKEKRDEFVKNYLSVENGGGVVAVDSKTEYNPIHSNPETIDKAQLEAVESKVYNYLGINKNIVASNYDEDQFSSFYESVLEPLATQLSLEFTEKLFTDKEIEFGNEIKFESSRLQFSSNESKLKLVKELLPAGVLTINDALEILHLPIIDGELGQKRLQTLNYIDMEQANAYQRLKNKVDTGDDNE